MCRVLTPAFGFRGNSTVLSLLKSLTIATDSVHNREVKINYKMVSGSPTVNKMA